MIVAELHLILGYHMTIWPTARSDFSQSPLLKKNNMITLNTRIINKLADTKTNRTTETLSSPPNHRQKVHKQIVQGKVQKREVFAVIQPNPNGLPRHVKLLKHRSMYFHQRHFQDVSSEMVGYFWHPSSQENATTSAVR